MHVHDAIATIKRPLQYFIKEESRHYTTHDQLFKQLIEDFFEVFLEAFFPYIHEHINFEHQTFFSEEMLELPISYEEKWS